MSTYTRLMVCRLADDGETVDTLAAVFAFENRIRVEKSNEIR